MSDTEIDAELEAWLDRYGTRLPGGLYMLRREIEAMSPAQRRRFVTWLDERKALRPPAASPLTTVPSTGMAKTPVRGFGLPLLLFTGPIEVRGREPVAAAA